MSGGTVERKGGELTRQSKDTPIRSTVPPFHRSSGYGPTNQVRDLLPGHRAVIVDEIARLEVEELPRLELIARTRDEQLSFDHLARLHLLRTIPTQSAE